MHFFSVGLGGDNPNNPNNPNYAALSRLLDNTNKNNPNGLDREGDDERDSESAYVYTSLGVIMSHLRHNWVTLITLITLIALITLMTLVQVDVLHVTTAQLPYISLG